MCNDLGFCAAVKRGEMCSKEAQPKGVMMDPNEALETIRSLYRDHGPDEWGQLADAVEALDDWLSKGGFLPAEWEMKGNRKSRAIA